jgi:hypothetical protein
MMADHMLRMLLFIATVEWFVVIKGIKDAIKSLLVWDALKSGLPKMDPTGLGTLFAVNFPSYFAERLILTFITVVLSIIIIYNTRRTS